MKNKAEPKQRFAAVYVTETQKQKIREAAAEMNWSVTTFLTLAGLAQADRILAEEEEAAS